MKKNSFGYFSLFVYCLIGVCINGCATNKYQVESNKMKNIKDTECVFFGSIAADLDIVSMDDRTTVRRVPGCIELFGNFMVMKPEPKIGLDFVDILNWKSNMVEFPATGKKLFAIILPGGDYKFYVRHAKAPGGSISPDPKEGSKETLLHCLDGKAIYIGDILLLKIDPKLRYTDNFFGEKDNFVKQYPFFKGDFIKQEATPWEMK